MHGRAERSKNLLQVNQLLPITESQPIGPRSNATVALSLSPGRIEPWMLELGLVRRDCRPLIGRAAEARAEFKRTRCAGLAPATVERFRAILQAAINYAAAEETWAQVRKMPID